MIRVLIADESPRITENIVKRLERESDLVVCGTAKDGEYAVQEALRLQPDVAIIDAGLPGMDGVQTTEMLAQYLPRTGVIMMSMEAENEAYRHAMLAGAREFLQKPFKGDDMVAAIRRVHAFEQRKAVPEAAKVETTTATAGPTEGTGQVITVFAGKGGVGKSAIAANLAVVLARHGSKVALVDCSLQFGDIGALLNLAADRTIADLAANDAVADREVIQQVLIEGPEGVRVLLAPISPELADYVTTQHLRALMEELRRTYDFIVIDSTSYLNEISLDAIEMADRVLLVTDMSVTAIKNTRLVLTVMEVLKIDRERFLIVANHRDGHSELERTYAENFLKNPIAVEIPYEPGVVATSISHGVPFVVSNQQSPVTARLEELATLVAPKLAPSTEPVAGAAGADDKNKKKQRRLLGFARS
jgi:pilus assembly protein CpaE